MAIPAYAQKGLSGQDQEFATKAASGGMMEVQLGKMAQEKAQSQEVQTFGSRMTKDHGNANEELKKLAQQKNLTLPTDLAPKHKATVDKLEKASGAQFDQQYMQEMVKDHTKDVAKFRKAGKTVKDPDLKAWAEKTLPILESHLEQAKGIAQKVGVDVNKAEEDARTELEKKK